MVQLSQSGNYPGSVSVFANAVNVMHLCQFGLNRGQTDSIMSHHTNYLQSRTKFGIEDRRPIGFEFVLLEKRQAIETSLIEVRSNQ